MRWIVRGALMVALSALLLGCGAGLNVKWPWSETGNKAPKITNLQITPATVRFTGGQVTVRATVTDDEAVAHAWAIISPPTPGTRIDLTAGAGGIYQATWMVPSNHTGSQAKTYTIVIHATDDKGKESTLSTTFQVPPPPAPPDAPF